MPAAMLTLTVVLALAAPPPGPTDTKVVLLLDDLSVVEAEPTKDGYAVRRGKHLEPVPAGRVRFAGDSRAAVHRHLLAEAGKPAAPPPAVGFAAGSLPLFAARVQPVLQNRCAGCHARPDHRGGFRLADLPGGYADPAAAERNARAAALHLDRANPAGSPLLVFAAAPHGGAVAAPLPRSHPAFHPLEQWAALHAGPPGPRPTPTPAPVAPPAPAPAKPAADPTDPGPFNRAAHPGR